jgi:hypothetical protein
MPVRRRSGFESRAIPSKRLTATKSRADRRSHARDPRGAHPRPKDTARDLANLANPLARLTKDEASAPPDSPAILFRPGTLILEPGRRSREAERRHRLMRRTRDRINICLAPITTSQPRTRWTLSSCTSHRSSVFPGKRSSEAGKTSRVRQASNSAQVPKSSLAKPGGVDPHQQGLKHR